MWNGKSVILATAGATALLFLLWRPATVRPQASEPPDNLQQFRIVVGLTDTAPKPWQGAISVSGGELAEIKGWRFSQQDRVEASGEFQRWIV